MSEYYATVRWQRAAHEAFVDNNYSRAHHWHFDGGAIVAASSSPHIVPLPHSVAENVDPEEAFVAALSSCHMLFFLAFAAKRGFVVATYEDQAFGVLAKAADGRQCMTEVTLRPYVAFVGEAPPERNVIEQLHHRAHEACFIANSVTSRVQLDLSRQT